MLRESAIAYKYEIDLAAISDTSIPIGIPGGNLLLELVDVLHGVSDEALADIQSALIDRLGPEALVDAAAVFGNFQMMNRVAEGSGIPIPQQAIDRESDLVTKLGLLDLMKN
ncbi:MAG: hypothetical protein BMS9Abin17_0580 [Acidimicrobiia bacterium]|nr:MAG: hypothetical protein BMS9Abin17_0580 [Acidimicrobiia bacterium]